MAKQNSAKVNLLPEILLFFLLLIWVIFSKLSRIHHFDPLSISEYGTVILSEVTFVSCLFLLLLSCKILFSFRAYTALFTVITTTFIIIEFFAWRVYHETGIFLDWESVLFSIERFAILQQVLAEKLSFLNILGLLIIPIALAAICIISYEKTYELNTKYLYTSLGYTSLIFIIYTGFGNIYQLPTDQFRSTSTHLVIGFLNTINQINLTPDVHAKASVESHVQHANTDQAPNIVIIILESTRAQSVDPYVDINVTPFFEELSETSLLFLNAYSTSPHTSKAVYSIVCGNFPRASKGIYEAAKGGIQHECLPHILNKQGYRSAYFQSATESFENRRQLVDNMGYQEFFPVEVFDTSHYEKANYFGYEDEVMLPASNDWLRKNKDKGAVLTTYLTVTPHFHYDAISRYGWKKYSNNSSYNGYLNTLHYQDNFIKSLVNQYKSLGLYDNTIFIITGDHGEAFKEHNLWGHGNVLFEEVVKVPMLIHYSDKLKGRVKKVSSIMDIAPSALTLSGFEYDSSIFEGLSYNEFPEAERDILLNCGSYDYCSALINGENKLKYIYSYGRNQDYLFNISEDPLEKTNLVDSFEYKGQVKQLKARLINSIDSLKTHNDVYSLISEATVARFFTGRRIVPSDNSLKITYKQQNEWKVLHASVSKNTVKPRDIIYVEYTLPYLDGGCVYNRVSGINNNHNRKHILPKQSEPYVTIKESYNVNNLKSINSRIIYKSNCGTSKEKTLSISFFKIPITIEDDEYYQYDRRTYLSYKKSTPPNIDLYHSGNNFIRYLLSSSSKVFYEVPVDEYFSEKFRKILKEKFLKYNTNNLSVENYETWCSREDAEQCIYRYKVTYNRTKKIDIRLYSDSGSFTRLYYYTGWEDQLKL